MRRSLLAILFGLSMCAMPAAAAAQGATTSEEAAAKVPLENYFKGHAFGDGTYMRRAFHPDAKICSNRDGKLSCMTAEEFAGRFTTGPAKDEAQRKRVIVTLDVTGDSAFAKLLLDYPSVKFTDYMTLMKVDGEWKIMNKVFYADRRPATPAPAVKH